MRLSAFMELRKAKARYAVQKYQAKKRGIDWHLTFDEWLGWWGDDLDRRGPRKHQLQMQRPLDAGPYALWNITKGYPKDNGVTRSQMHRNMQTTYSQRGTYVCASQPEVDDDGEERDGPRLGYVTSYSAYGIG